MKLKLLVVALIATFVFAGCSDDDSPKFSNKPSALAANDNSGKGIYKGVIVGSTGRLTINIDNKGDGKITATLIIDGKKINLTTESTYNNGFEGCFYGTLEDEDDVELCFYVSADGEDWDYDMTIPGHEDARIQVIKELSDELVMAFEGTYLVMGETGTLNIVARLDSDNQGSWYGIAKIDSEVDVLYNLSGEVYVEEGATLVVGGGGVFQVAGTRSGDKISGGCNKGEGEGTFSVKRTL